jgi:hypothetical protein
MNCYTSEHSADDDVGDLMDNQNPQTKASSITFFVVLWNVCAKWSYNSYEKQLVCIEIDHFLLSANVCVRRLYCCRGVKLLTYFYSSRLLTRFHIVFWQCVYV